MEVRQKRDHHLTISKYLVSNITSVIHKIQLEDSSISTTFDHFFFIIVKFPGGIHYACRAAVRLIEGTLDLKTLKAPQLLPFSGFAEPLQHRGQDYIGGVAF